MKKLLIATHNLNKVKEFQAMLEAFSFKIISLNDLNVKDEVAETELTFEANALLKAKYYSKLTGYMTLSDDSGLEILALNNLPGIYSARFLGSKNEYITKNKIILETLKDKTNRSARYVCAVSLVTPDGKIFTKTGILNGVIASNPSGDYGFGYDPIFIPDGYNVSLAALPPSEKNKISHRGQAISQLSQTLKELNK